MNSWNLGSWNIFSVVDLPYFILNFNKGMIFPICSHPEITLNLYLFNPSYLLPNPVKIDVSSQNLRSIQLSVLHFRNSGQKSNIKNVIFQSMCNYFVTFNLILFEKVKFDHAKKCSQLILKKIHIFLQNNITRKSS